MSFYYSREWRELRYKVLIRHGRKCMVCNNTDKELHVDHIKPRSKFPKLELEFNNLQVLCADCNVGKSNIYEDDLREPEGNGSFIHASNGKIFHFWDGSETGCNMWRTGGIKKKDKYIVCSSVPGVKVICSMCKNNYPQLFNEMVKDFGYQ